MKKKKKICKAPKKKELIATGSEKTKSRKRKNPSNSKKIKTKNGHRTNIRKRTKNS